MRTHSRPAVLHRLVMSALCILVICSCAEQGPKSVPVEGQVFVVTKGRESVKMGLVTVEAYPESTITTHVARKLLEKERNQSGIDSMLIAVEEQAEAALKVARLEAEYQAARKRVTACSYLEYSLASLLAGESLEAVVDTINSIHERMKSERAMRYMERGSRKNYYEVALEVIREKQAVFNRLSSDHAVMVQSLAALLYEARRSSGRADVHALALVARYGRFRTGRLFLEGLPSPPVSLRTGADGDFSLTLPENQRVAFAASSDRETPGGRENYYWLVWFTPRSDTLNQIILSNDNVTSSGNPESVVFTEE